MDSSLVSLKGSYLLVPIAIVVGLLLLFLDSLVTGRKVTKQDYLKQTVIILIISAGIVFIHTLKGKPAEEILSGVVPF